MKPSRRRPHLSRLIRLIESLEPRTLLSAGVLDTTFGTAGAVLFSSVAGVNGIATQPNGDIIPERKKLGHRLTHVPGFPNVNAKKISNAINANTRLACGNTNTAVFRASFCW